MAESTLTLKLDDLLQEAALFLGWGRDSARWSDAKKADLREIVASALRKFYFQASARPQDPPHAWTFLKPVARLHLITGESEIGLPEDFGGFDGEATISLSTTTSGYWPLKEFPEETIRIRYAAAPTVRGRPQMYATTARRGTNEARSSRYNLLIYPLPDYDYTFRAPYSVLPGYLTDANPYPYGGAEHAETLKAGVRAAAEIYEDAEAGEQNQNYQMALAASIGHDRRHQPKTLGVNSDTSDYMRGQRYQGFPDGLWHPLGIGFLSEATYG